MSASTSPLPYTGNKSCIVNTILTVMPKHSVYIEPCMGSAEVFFRKPKAEREILNDYNGDLVNLFRTIQSNKKLVFLIGRLSRTAMKPLSAKASMKKRRRCSAKSARAMIGVPISICCAVWFTAGPADAPCSGRNTPR